MHVYLFIFRFDLQRLVPDNVNLLRLNGGRERFDNLNLPISTTAETIRIFPTPAAAETIEYLTNLLYAISTF
jgi:hypothetical protein